MIRFPVRAFFSPRPLGPRPQVELVAPDCVYLPVPYTNGAKGLRVESIFWKVLGQHIGLHVKTAWCMKPNTMRRLYSLNWRKAQHHKCHFLANSNAS